jgi:membrane protein
VHGEVKWSRTTAERPETDGRPAPVSAPEDDGRGRHAEKPREVPARGWKDILVRTWVETKNDNVSLLAAGVAFYAMLALVPALIAAVGVYGLVADPNDIERQISDLLGAAPAEVRDLLVSQLEQITQDRRSAIGLSAIIGLVVALWSASSGTKQLIAAINAAYDETETRKFFKLRGLSLALTIGAIFFLLVMVGLIAFLPALLDAVGLGDTGRTIASIVRWPLVLVLFVIGLLVMYRLGPDRDNPEWRWASPGAIVAAVLFLAGSILFSVYTARFASYGKTYGSLGSIVVLMLWLLLTSYAIIFGAELNSELERQTAHDTTEGADRPLGERDANAADTVGATAKEVLAEQKRQKGG